MLNLANIYNLIHKFMITDVSIYYICLFFYILCSIFTINYCFLSFKIHFFFFVGAHIFMYVFIYIYIEYVRII